ncbi:MAG: FeoB-associated Cys-rich membrane protein [Planctomycetes bacterium]|nr:FeoB-associated Cys-rich membrane protein [Planctomycetota bacterium]
MDWQTVIVTVVIVAAAAYLIRCIVLASRSSATGGCGGGCRCDDAAKAASDRLGRKRELVQLGSRNSDKSSSDASAESMR